MNKTWIIAFSIAAAVVIGVAIAFSYGLTGSSSSDNSNGTDDGSLNGGSSNNSGNGEDFVVLPESNPPLLRDPSLKVEKVAQGLTNPTSMAFIDVNDVIILQKDDGRIRFVSNGTLLDAPIYRVAVNSASERGLLGIAVAKEADGVNQSMVFLYYTEESAGEIRNRVYRHSWSSDGSLVDRSMILDLPGTPGPNHDGGKLAVGPDGMLYAVIGDLNRNGMLQNYPSGDRPDDTSVILRVDSSGNADPGNVLGHENEEISQALGKYYAYGIRNSFGMDFDPVTGDLWDTENGPSGYDELNLVSPGFNSGWEKVMGPIERSNVDPGELVIFDGSHYRDPVFSWRAAEAVTDIEFFSSDKLGEEYENNIFLGDFNNGNLYFFTVNEGRDGVSFDPESNEDGLADLVADNRDELDAVTFGQGFGAITDIETGLDGYLYILSFRGNLYRIVPTP